jgi:hypothetical protein
MTWAAPTVLSLTELWHSTKAGMYTERRLQVVLRAGAVVSPLLANVYLHYVFDLWVEAWRKKVTRGEVIVVRYADDLVLDFQNRADAKRFQSEFQERLVSGEDTSD